MAAPSSTIIGAIAPLAPMPTWDDKAPAAAAGGAVCTAEDDKMCVVCMEVPRSALFLNCGHLVTCAKCAESVFEQKVCCTCRCPIEEVIYNAA